MKLGEYRGHMRATGRKILKEIRRENFEKSIVEKGSFAYKRPY